MQYGQKPRRAGARQPGNRAFAGKRESFSPGSASVQGRFSTLSVLCKP
ncbi:hypothetical protein HMPREF3150_04396 [Pseudomonas aeruginosa]|nr:hypothetical protein HMPREF3150_04396 [Pseudomonas aeruginosa]